MIELTTLCPEKYYNVDNLKKSNHGSYDCKQTENLNEKCNLCNYYNTSS